MNGTRFLNASAFRTFGAPDEPLRFKCTGCALCVQVTRQGFPGRARIVGTSYSRAVTLYAPMNCRTWLIAASISPAPVVPRAPIQDLRHRSAASVASPGSQPGHAVDVGIRQARQPILHLSHAHFERRRLVLPFDSAAVIFESLWPIGL